MTLGNLIANSIVDNSTEIIIRCEDSFHVIASGKRHEDNILNYIDTEIEGFTWEKENIIYIDIIESSDV